jgi:sugar diacid utilization regulator
VEELAQRLLALLVEDAHPSQLRTLEQEHVEARGGAQEAEIRATVDLAVQLRLRLDRYKRRATELSALYDTAGDLSSLRDVERVLQAIVRRSRTLLGTEVAYLMLLDEERGDAYMRVTEGTSTPGFMDIRLELGVGLGGLVAATARPHWTSDYVGDRDYVHAVDDAVLAERLTAILGVPLRVGRRVLGVLFAADRGPRLWAQEEVSLLASLGAHAAIALENASLFQETREAMARLSAAKQVIERHNSALERAADLHERLAALILRGGDLHGIAAAVSEVLGREMLVTDADGRVLARAGADDAALPRGVMSSVHAAIASRATVTTDTQNDACHVTPVVMGDACLGALVLIGGPPPAPPDARALERAAMVTALLWVTQRAQDEAENRVRGELLAQLLSGAAVDSPSLARRAELIGVDLRVPMVVVVARTDDPARLGRVQMEASALVAAARGLMTVQGEALVLFLPGSDPQLLADYVARQLNVHAEERTTVGAAGPVPNLLTLPPYVREAERCVRALAMLGRHGEGASAAHLGVYALLVGEASEELTQQVVANALGELARYDVDRGTSLLETVEQYYEHDGNVAQAAQALFVHTNTLYQRLDRVDQLLGPEWRPAAGRSKSAWHSRSVVFVAESRSCAPGRTSEDQRHMTVLLAAFALVTGLSACANCGFL